MDALVRSLEEHLADWFREQRHSPDAQVHDDPDCVWVMQPGSAWGNAGTLLRFSERTVVRRLDAILDHYGRGPKGVGGFWVSELATPPTVTEELKRRGLTCRKKFPVMRVDLAKPLPRNPLPRGVAIVELNDTTLFRQHGHPYWGRISTDQRRMSMSRIDVLTALKPKRVFSFAATEDGKPVASCVLYTGKATSSLWDVGVVETARRRGIGAAIVSHACKFARTKGSSSVMLISSGEGEGVYRRAGFSEACRFAFWYANLRAGAAARRATMSAILRSVSR